MHMESQWEEWKESWTDDVLKTVAAFASKDGGRSIIGKNDKGVIVGVRNPKKLLTSIPNTISNLMHFHPHVEAKEDNGNVYIIVTINPQGRAVDYKGVYYRRAGATTVRVTGKDLREFIMECGGMVWSSLITDKVKLKDISKEAVSTFVKRGQEVQRISSAADPNDVEGILRRYSLMTDEGMTNAGAILFAEYPTVSHATVTKIGLFDENGRIVMEDVIKMPVIFQPEEVYKRLTDKYVQPRFELDGVVRREKYRYPPLALRESIFNAIMHRQYMRSEHTTISVHPDFIEIYNPGSLPEGWTAKTLPTKHESKPSNPLIAEIFHDMGIVEQWGRGMTLIHDECEKAGAPQPTYKVNKSGITVTFRPVPDVSEGVVIGIEDLGPLEHNVYKMILEGRYTKAEEVAKLLGSSEKGIRRITDKLKDAGLIRRVGSDRSGRWEPTGKVANRKGI